MTDISYERISPVKIGGGGYGNIYNFKVTCGDLTTYAACERDVAFNYEMAKLPVPDELKGPYDGYGNPVRKATITAKID